VLARHGHRLTVAGPHAVLAPFPSHLPDIITLRDQRSVGAGLTILLAAIYAIRTSGYHPSNLPLSGALFLGRKPLDAT
jgi:hypothetical protein